MQKPVKFIGIFLIVIICSLIGLCAVTEYCLVHRLPAFIEALSTPAATITTARIQPDLCLIKACAIVRDVTLKPANTDTVSLGDVHVAIPLRWPWQIEVATDSHHTVAANLVIGKDRTDIHTLKGTLDSFVFQVTGSIEHDTGRGQLILHTIGLRRFLTRVMPVPKWLHFLITDDPQEFTLSVKNNTIWLFGLPIFSLP